MEAIRYCHVRAEDALCIDVSIERNVQSAESIVTWLNFRLKMYFPNESSFNGVR